MCAPYRLYATLPVRFWFKQLAFSECPPLPVAGILSRHFLMHSLGKPFQRIVWQNTLFKPLNAMWSNLTFLENDCHPREETWPTRKSRMCETPQLSSSTCPASLGPLLSFTFRSSQEKKKKRWYPTDQKFLSFGMRFSHQGVWTGNPPNHTTWRVA